MCQKCPPYLIKKSWNKWVILVLLLPEIQLLQKLIFWRYPVKQNQEETRIGRPDNIYAYFYVSYILILY